MKACQGHLLRLLTPPDAPSKSSCDRTVGSAYRKTIPAKASVSGAGREEEKFDFGETEL